MNRPSIVLTVAAALSLGACATVPTGPSVMVMPGQGKNFEQFQADDAVCRGWAGQQTGTTPGHAATASTVSGAAIGTALGAAAGAVIGAASGSPATGAAVGAGVGLLGGTAVGAGQSVGAADSVQQRYDMAYTQCMYAKGNQVPVRSAGFAPMRASVPSPVAVQREVVYPHGRYVLEGDGVTRAYQWIWIPSAP